MQPRHLSDVAVKVWESEIEDKLIRPWDWCRQNVENGKFYAHYGLMRSGPSTYWFENREDALAFKLFYGMKLTRNSDD